MTRAAIATLLIGVVLAPLNSTMISVALVPISDDLGVNPGTVMWLVVSLYLSSGVAQPLAGVLVDRIGSRIVFICGLALVALAGLLPVVGHHFVIIVFARILLGFGLVVAYPAALAYVRNHAHQTGTVVPPATLAVISTASLATAAVGPVVGGVLVTHFGWVATFWVNTPLAGLGMVCAAFFLRGAGAKASQPMDRGWTLDVIGLTLFTIAITCLSAVLLSADVPVIVFVLISVSAGIGFIFWERKTVHPFIDVRLLLKNGPLTRTYGRLLLTFVGTYTITYALSQWLQYRAGMGALEAGLMLLPMAVTAAIVTILVSRSERVFSSLVVAAVCSLAGGLALSMIASTTPKWAIIACVATFGVTHGLGAVSNQLALYRFAPAEVIGAAAGLSRSAVSMSALATSAFIAVAFPASPTDAGLHFLGLVVSGCAVLVLVLLAFDRSLRLSE